MSPTRRNNRKNTRKNNRKASRRNVKKGGYRIYKLWPRNRIIAFVNELVKRGKIANPGSVNEASGLEILAEVAGVSVNELQNEVNPILFGKVHLEMNESDLERSILKGRSESSFMNQMEEMRKELQWANKAAFDKINFGNTPQEINKNKHN